MKESIVQACAVLAFSGFAGLSAADTLTVPGTHGTIADALAAAVSGDVIELTSNINPYVGNIYVTKNNITIQGQAGLDPKPLIQGDSEVHPLAGQGPQKWFWQMGDATSSNFWFDTHGAAIINAAEDLTLLNLRISADPAEARPVTGSVTTAGVLDFRFGSGGHVEDCVLDGTGPGAIGAERLVMTSNDHIFQDVVFQNGRIPLEHQAGAGTLQVIDCSITGQQHTLWMNGGTVEFSGTTIDSSSASGSNLGCLISNEYGASDVTFTSCVFRKSSGAGTDNGFVQLRHHNRGTAFGIDDYNSGRYSPLPVEARFDQCDFIGDPGQEVRRVVNLETGRVGWVVKTLRFTGCNFFNIQGNPFLVADFPYPGNDYKAGGEVDRFEDYNVFKLAQNMAPIVGIASGGNSITLDADPLYVDPAGDDFRLASNSPAATLQGSETPAYTGALGVADTAVAPVRITVGHTGADHTSINAAIAAAPEGALIEITDSSAPYLEGVYLGNGSRGITLQGAPTLSPRPSISAPVTTTSAVRLAAGSRNITLRNLVIDGTALVLPDSMVLDTRDAGESIVENCEIIGGPGVAWSVFSQASRIMRDCVVTCAANRPAVQQNLNSNFALQNCQIESAGTALTLEGGMFLVTDSYVRGDGTETINLGFNGTPIRSSYFDIRDSIITTNATGAAAVANNLIVVRNTAGRRTMVIDNSDLVGSLQATGPGQSPTGSIIWVVGGGATVNPMTYMKVTDSIFYNSAVYSIFFDGNTAPVTIPGLVFDPTLGVEDYNAFKWSPEAFATQGITQGLNDLNLDGADLYVDAPNDFRLLATSPAAMLNSTGVPPYAGSQGVVGSSVKDWSVY